MLTEKAVMIMVMEVTVMAKMMDMATVTITTMVNQQIRLAQKYHINQVMVPKSNQRTVPPIHIQTGILLHLTIAALGLFSKQKADQAKDPGKT